MFSHNYYGISTFERASRETQTICLWPKVDGGLERDQRRAMSNLKLMAALFLSSGEVVDELAFSGYHIFPRAGASLNLGSESTQLDSARRKKRPSEISSVLLSSMKLKI